MNKITKITKILNRFAYYGLFNHIAFFIIYIIFCFGIILKYSSSSLVIIFICALIQVPFMIKGFMKWRLEKEILNKRRLDKEILNKNRIQCKYPMSEFYAYEDEVPSNTRVSTPEDCEKCDSLEFDNNEKCTVIDSLLEKKFCLIKDKRNEKR